MSKTIKELEMEIRETEELIFNYQNKRDELKSELDSIKLQTYKI